MSARRSRPMPRNGTGLRVSLVRRSTNRKTGAIPVAMTDAASCPDACALKNNGCWAEQLPWLRHRHWLNVEKQGMRWRTFCTHVLAFPPGQLWRYGEAGDLPGRGNRLDVDALEMLVRANSGRRGHAFTAKPLRSKEEREAVRHANARGFTINLSATSLARADELADLGIGPVTVVVATDAARRLKTPAGRTVVLCPFETHRIQCAACQLCAKAHRKAIIGFPAHGQARVQVSVLVQLRRKAVAA